MKRASHVTTRLVGLASFALVGLFARGATAANGVTYCDFSNQTQIANELQVNGDAVASGAQLHLTPNSTNKTGSVYFKNAFPWTATTSFHTHFRFKLYPNTGSTGGDGFTFTLQNKKATSVGGSGGGLGYNGVGSSVAVEFDTTQNSGDPSDNYVGVLADGNVNTHLASSSAPVNLKSGNSIDAWIDYNGTTHSLSVYVANSPAAKPVSPTLTTIIDVSAHVGSQAWVGFTAATGSGETNNQDINYWVFDGNDTTPTDCLPCSSDTDCTSTPSTPACEPNHFCGQCSATNQTQCSGQTPVCIVSVGKCGGCNTSADCSGNTPVCNTTTHLCRPCASDTDCTNAAEPACQLTGPLAGSCGQCSSTNATLCTGPTPVCLTTVGTCGCSTNGQCGANQLCEGNPPTCQPGCIVGTKDCQTPLVCSVQDGGTGVCQNPSTGCTGNGDCTTDPLRVCMNPGPSGTCVQCTQTSDCSGNLVCDTTRNTCVTCTPSSTGNCSSAGSGPLCLTGDVCGCSTDSDCGGLTSGRVCDDTVHVCIAGCRGLGGNACPLGLVCSSSDTSVGTCGTLGGDGGLDGSVGDGGGLDGSTGDGGKDGGKQDAGLDGSFLDGSSNDGAASDGSSSHDGATGDGSSEDDGGFGTSIEGGACSCSTTGEGGAPFGALLATGALVSLWAGRRRRQKNQMS